MERTDQHSGVPGIFTGKCDARQEANRMVFFPHRHLLGIKGLSHQDITLLLDKADEAVKISRQREKKTSTLRASRRSTCSSKPRRARNPPSSLPENALAQT